MRRLAVRSTQIFIDLTILALAFGLAFVARFDGLPPHDMLKRLVLLWPYVVAYQYLVLVFFGVHRFVWRYVSLREVKTIALALGACAAVLIAGRVLSPVLSPSFGYAKHALVPIGVILVNFTLSFVGI